MRIFSKFKTNRNNSYRLVELWFNKETLLRSTMLNNYNWEPYRLNCIYEPINNPVLHPAITFGFQYFIIAFTLCSKMAYSIKGDWRRCYSLLSLAIFDNCFETSGYKCLWHNFNRLIRAILNVYTCKQQIVPIIILEPLWSGFLWTQQIHYGHFDTYIMTTLCNNTLPQYLVSIAILDQRQLL